MRVQLPPRQTFQHLSSAPNNLLASSASLGVRSISVRAKDELLAFDPDFDLGADFPPNLSKDGLIEGQARRVPHTTQSLGKGHGHYLL
jgi:hypothetical protein